PGVREAGAQRAELGLAPDEGDAGRARRYARGSPFGRARDGVVLHRPPSAAGTVAAPTGASAFVRPIPLEFSHRKIAFHVSFSGGAISMAGSEAGSPPAKRRPPPPPAPRLRPPRPS